MKRYEYIFSNLTCAHCTSVLENKLHDMDIFEDVLFSAQTKKVYLSVSSLFYEKYGTSSTEEVVREVLQDLINSIEEGVVVKPLQMLEKEVAHSSKWPVYSLLEVALGIFLLVAASLYEEGLGAAGSYVLICAYVMIGRKVLWTAIKNVGRKNFLDENFLMAVATLGAIGLSDYKEALGVMVFYRLGTIFEERASQESRKEIMAVMDLRPDVVRLITTNGIEIIPAHQVQVGDRVQVRTGDRIPLDGVLVKGRAVLDTSPVTGESKPRQVQEGEPMLSGCINTGGPIVMRVEKSLEESFVSKVLESVEKATTNKPSVDRLITRFAKYYTPLVLAVAVGTALIPSLFTGNWEYWTYTALTFLVISCPCALVLSVPLTFFAGMGGSSKRGILFKGGKSMEQLQDVRVIALDKTGTLTEGMFRVEKVVLSERCTIPRSEVLRYAASVERYSSHPIAKSIVEAAEDTLYEAKNVQEYAGEGMVAEVQGLNIALGNRRLLERLGITVLDDFEEMLGCSTILIAINGEWVADIYVKDALKKDAVREIQQLKQSGYTVAMLTGDTYESADVVAKEAGIMHVYAELFPDEKWRTITDLREQYGPVLFVGDGINDAPVLAGSDVGGAMGSGADAALEAADVVYMNTEVGSILRSIQLAKTTMRVAWQNVWMALLIKVLVMLLGFVGYASLWMAIFADTGVLVLCVLNAMRLLYGRR